MQVILLLAVLTSADPLCNRFCSTGVIEEQLNTCTETEVNLEKDFNFCKAAFKRAVITGQEYGGKLAICNQNLQVLESKLQNCKLKKKKHLPIKKPIVPATAAVVVVKEETKTCCSVAPAVTVVNNITVKVPAVAVSIGTNETSFWHRERPNWLLGLRGAGGVAFCAPVGIGLVGVRANWLPVHLGADVYTSFYHGTGAQLLVYPLQRRVVMWHINGGAVWFNQRPFLLPNLPRQIDLTLGTGLELRILPFLWITADLQVRMPNPIAIAATGEQFSTVLGKSLVQTQGMLGLMLRTW